MSNQSSKFPSDAEVVIVGVGGIVGSMLAYWLAELGQKNIVGLEKSTIIPSDIASTAHASDFVYNTTHDKLGCWATSFSRKFYEDNGFFLKKGAGTKNRVEKKAETPANRSNSLCGKWKHANTTRCTHKAPTEEKLASLVFFDDPSLQDHSVI